uniref:Uncharacterized protein n=1 Tax=Lepeophtheirus salmonis TaxID=72036 RepID=A0A0K2U0E4_LEPSM
MKAGYMTAMGLDRLFSKIACFTILRRKIFFGIFVIIHPFIFFNNRYGYDYEVYSFASYCLMELIIVVLVTVFNHKMSPLAPIDEAIRSYLILEITIYFFVTIPIILFGLYSGYYVSNFCELFLQHFFYLFYPDAEENQQMVTSESSEPVDQENAGDV